MGLGTILLPTPLCPHSTRFARVKGFAFKLILYLMIERNEGSERSEMTRGEGIREQSECNERSEREEWEESAVE